MADNYDTRARNAVLDKAKQYINGDREQDYGKPEHNLARIAEMWQGYIGQGVTITARDVALMMIMLKISRIRTGHDVEDSYVDIAGYAAIGYEAMLADQAADPGDAATLAPGDWQFKSCSRMPDGRIITQVVPAVSDSLKARIYATDARRADDEKMFEKYMNDSSRSNREAET